MISGGQVVRVVVEDNVFWALGFTVDTVSDAGAEPVIWRSEDGTSWERFDLGFPASTNYTPESSVRVWIDHLARIDDRYVALGWIMGAGDARQTTAWESVDGRTWRDLGPSPMYNTIDVTSGPEGLLAASHGFAAGTGSIWLSSDTGASWDERRPPGDSLEIRAVVGTQSVYVAAGGEGVAAPDDIQPRIWVSTDAGAWTTATLPGADTTGSVEAVTIDGSGTWVAVGTVDGRRAIWRANDPRSWELTPGFTSPDEYVWSTLDRLAGHPWGFLLVTRDLEVWESTDGWAWQAGETVPGAGGEVAEGLARIGNHVLLVRNLDPLGTGDRWGVILGAITD